MKPRISFASQSHFGFASVLALVLVIVWCHTSWSADQVIQESAPRDAADTAANNLAREVLSSDQFWWKRTARVAASTSWLDAAFSFVCDKLIMPVFKAIADCLEWLFDFIIGTRNIVPTLSTDISPYLWFALVVILPVVVWQLWRRFKPTPGQLIEAANRNDDNKLPQSDELLEEAQRVLTRGDQRTAIRLALLALLAWLQDAGRLKYDRSRSNREYQRDLQKWPGSLANFRRVAEPFEWCWYGGRQLSNEQVHAALAVCRTELQIVKEHE